MNKLYLDGCSFTYGHGLPRDESLGALFKTIGGYTVTDCSRPGKSNLAIALDTYKNVNHHDVFVIGWTFSSRFTIRYQEQDLDFFVGSHGKGFDIDPKSLDDAHVQVQKYFYTVFGHPFCDHLSDTLVDTTISHLRMNKKKIVCFGWEKRNISNHINYPFISPKERLSDGHLNSAGMLNLFHYIQNLIT